MPVPIRNAIIVLVLCLAALASWYLRAPEEGPVSNMQTRYPDLGYYLTDAIFSGLDADGQVIYQLAAARIEEFPESDMLSLETVELTYSDIAAVPWLIRAASAQSPRDGSYIALAGDVTIESTKRDSSETARIETEDLLFEPETNFASTPGPVSLAIGASRITAIGLSAYLKDERISLESDVHAEVAR